MPDPPHDEATLVDQAAAGDADAFGELYLQHLDAIYRYVYFRVGDTQEAEDITEQVFLKAWEALPSYKPCGKRFSSWLYRIAHNAVVDHHRRQKPILSGSLSETPAHPHPSFRAPALGGVEGKRGISPPNSHTPILDQVIQAEEAATLATAIAQLPEEQQQIILLRFVEGLRHAEVAHIVGVSEGASRVIQHRALAALNQLLTGGKG